MSLRQDVFRVAHATLPTLRWIVLLLLPGIYLLSGFYSVASEQRGVLFRFGKLVEADIPPGMHYRLPWPFEQVEVLATSSVRLLDVDFAQIASPGLSTEVITGDTNLVDLAYRLQYRIAEPARFMTATAGPEALLLALARSETLAAVSDRPVSMLLTTGRSELQIQLRQRLQMRLDQLATGIKITGVQIRRLAPPRSVLGGFEAVAGARAERQKAIQQAQGQRSAELARARAEANQRLARAQAAALERTEQAAGDLARYQQSLTAYRAAPQIAAGRLHQETLAAVLAQARIKVFPASVVTPAGDVASMHPGGLVQDWVRPQRPP